MLDYSFGSNVEITQSIQLFFFFSFEEPRFFPGGVFKAFKGLWQVSQFNWHLFRKVNLRLIFNDSLYLLYFMHTSIRCKGCHAYICPRLPRETYFPALSRINIFTICLIKNKNAIHCCLLLS